MSQKTKKGGYNIWPSFGTINSIQKVNKIELEGMKGSKPEKLAIFHSKV